MASAKVSLRELADLAIGTPEVGAVNFTALHALIVAILKNLNLHETKIDFKSQALPQVRHREAPQPSISAPQLSVPKERKKSLSKVHPQVLESQVKDLSKQLKTVESQVQDIVTHVQHLTSQMAEISPETQEWLEGQSATMMMPKKAVATLMPKKAGAVLEPEKTEATLEPEKAMATVDSQEAKATLESQEAKATLEPKKARATLEPKKARATPESQEVKATLEPEKAVTTLEPKKFTATTLVPEKVATKMIPKKPVFTMVPEKLMTTKVPEESTTTMTSEKLQQGTLRVGKDDEVAEISITQALELLQDVIEEVQTLKEAQQKMQELPEMKAQAALESRLEELEKTVRERDYVLSKVGRKLSQVNADEVTMVTWEELEQAIADGLKGSQVISEMPALTLKRKGHLPTSAEASQSAIATKHPSTDSRSSFAASKSLSTTSGTGQPTYRTLSKDRRAPSTVGLLPRDQHPRTPDEAGAPRPYPQFPSQLRGDVDQPRSQEQYSSLQPRRAERAEQPRPAPQYASLSRDQLHLGHLDQQSDIYLSPEQVYLAQSQQGLGPPDMDQTRWVYPSSHLYEVVPPSTDQQGFISPGRDEQGLLPGTDQPSMVPPGIDQHDVGPFGRDQSGFASLGMSPYDLFIDHSGLMPPGLMQAGTDQQAFVQSHLEAPGFTPPGTEQQDLVQPGAVQSGLIQPGADHLGLVQPRADQHGLVQPSAYPHGWMQPGAYPPGLTQPGAYLPGVVQPGMYPLGLAPFVDQSGSVQHGTEQREPAQTDAEQRGSVQPGTEHHDSVQPGTEQRDSVQPGTEQRDLVQAGADQRGLVQPGARPPTLVQPGTYPLTLRHPGAYPPTLRHPGAYPPTLRHPGAYPHTLRYPGAYPSTPSYPGVYPPTMRHPGAYPPTLRHPGAHLPSSAQLGADLSNLVLPGADQRGGVPPGADQRGGVPPGADQRGGVPPGADQRGGVPPGADQRGGVPPGADQRGGVPPGADQRGGGPPGADQRGGGPPGADQRGGGPPGADQRGGGPPGADQRGGGPPGADQRGGGPPGADQGGGGPPGVDRDGAVQPSVYPQGLIQPGAYPHGLIPPGAYPHGLVPPGAYPHGLIQPGAYPVGLVQPGMYPRGLWVPGAQQRGTAPYGLDQRALFPPSTELRDFPPSEVDSSQPYQQDMVPPERGQHGQVPPPLDHPGLTSPGVGQESSVPQPDQQDLVPPDSDQSALVYPGPMYPGYHGPQYPGIGQYGRIGLYPAGTGASYQPEILAHTFPAFVGRRPSYDVLDQSSSEYVEDSSERRDSLDKLAPSFPIAVETFRVMGELVGLYTEFKNHLNDLEEDLAGQTDLEKIQYMIALMVKKNVPPDLQEQVKGLKVLTKEVRQEKAKLDRLQKILDGDVVEETGKEPKASQLGLQLGILRVTVTDIEKELAELKESQERGKVTMEHSVSEASCYLQDQLDKLRTIIESMLTSSSTLLSMSLPPPKHHVSLTPGQIDPEATCPACSLDVSHQVSVLVQRYEQLQNMVNNLAASRPTKKAKLQSKDEELLGHVQNAILQVQGDCEKLNLTTSSLIQDHQEKQKDIAVLYQGIQKLEKEKANREHLEMEIDVKADKSALASKVSRVQFDATTEQLNHMMQELVAKMSGQEQDWQKMLDRLLQEMDRKLDRLELDPVKHMLEDRWKSLRQQLKEQSPLHQADEAAAMRRQLLAHFHCLSCDRPLETSVTGQVIPMTPVGPSLPGHRSIRPYTVYELEQVRQQSRNLKTGCAFPRGDLGQMEQSVGRLHSMHSKMLRDIEKVQIHFGGSVKASSQMIRELLQAQCLSTPCYKRAQDVADYSYPPVPRRCGGSHTLTYPYRRSRLQHQPQGLYSTEEIQIAMKHDEVDILGLDGHIYKGRMDTRLPDILTKDVAGVSKHKSKHTRPPTQRQQTAGSNSRLPLRPQSAQMLAGNDSAPPRQQKERPVSTEGRLSQSNVAHPPSPDVAALQSGSAGGLEMHLDLPPREGPEEPTRGPRSTAAH